MPPEIWVVLGNPNVGKSTTIRALTGVFTSRYTDVQTIQGRLSNIFVEVSSLQEKR